jgi:1,2-diacylglycerol 3-alpha-glucosyltransferase
VRIAFVSDTFEGMSGANVSGRRFVEALRGDHEVTVVSTDPPRTGMVQVPGFRIVHNRAMRENQFMFGWPRRTVLEAVFAHVDVVHVQFPFRLGHGAVKLAGEMGIPCVAAFHVQPQHLLYGMNVHSSAVAGVIYQAWIRNVFQPADAVIVPSLFGCRRLRAHGLTTPAWFVSNGPRLRLARRTDRGGPPYLVLSVGRLAREKRHDLVMQAVGRSKHRSEISLVIAGAGPLEGRLQAMAERCPVPVEIAYAPDERLIELYDQATLLIHASEVELEGMAVVDAMAAGLPALIADAAESASAGLAAGPDFLFVPGDASDLAVHLDRLLDDPVLRAAGARRSFKYADDNDFEHSVARIERIYETMLGRRVPAEPSSCSPDSCSGPDLA